MYRKHAHKNATITDVVPTAETIAIKEQIIATADFSAASKFASLSESDLSSKYPWRCPKSKSFALWLIEVLPF